MKYRVGITMPVTQCFYSTQELGNNGQGDGLAEETERLRTATFHLGRLATDQMPFKFGTRVYSTLMACSRRDIEELTDTLRQNDLPEPSFVPFVWAVARAGLRQVKPPKTKNLWLWVSLDTDQGMIALIHDTRPLAWRYFGFTPEYLAAIIKSNTLFMILHASKDLSVESPTAIMVDGEESARQVAMQVFTELELHSTELKRAPDHEADASLGAGAELPVAADGDLQSGADPAPPPPAFAN